MDATASRGRPERTFPRRSSSFLRGLPYLFPILLIVLYISAVTSPPNRHSELIQLSESGDAALARDLAWASESRDWQWGSMTVQRDDQSTGPGHYKETALAARNAGDTRLGRFAMSIEEGVQRIGDFIAMLLGFDDDEEDEVSGAQDGTGLSTWAESSIYVEVSVGIAALIECR